MVRSVGRETQAERVAVVGGEGAGEVPTGDDNLVWRSVVAFCEAHDVAVPDVAVRASSTIPLERGLGSSSAAIVAGLVLGRSLTEVTIGDRDLVALASELEGHPDNVAPALLGGLVACGTDDDGEVVVRRVNPAPTLRPVALVPATRQATSAARAVLPDSLPRADVAEQAARAGHVLAALAGVWPAAATLAGDRLHEPARFAAMPATGAAVVAAARRRAARVAVRGGTLRRRGPARRDQDDDRDRRDRGRRRWVRRPRSGGRPRRRGLVPGGRVRDLGDRTAACGAPTSEV